MIISKIDPGELKRRKPGAGRKPFYNFHDLNPGEKLHIPKDGNLDVSTQMKRVSSAVCFFKRANNLSWHTNVRNVDGQIFVYRLH